MLDHKRQNNFDAVRLFLAVTVVLGHLIWILPGYYGPLAIFIDHFDGPSAVDCFFVISGFLIFRSFRRSNSQFAYWDNRVRRIYPALVAIILTTVILGAYITVAPLGEYLAPAVLRYAPYNLLFMSFKQNTLPGLFTDNVVNYVNGSLWTLKIEVLFYATVPLIIFVSRRFVRFELLACAIYILSVLFKVGMHHLALTRNLPIYDNWGNQLPGQLSFFVAGGILEYYLTGFRQRAILYLILAIVGLAINAELSVYALYPISLAVVVIFACSVFPFIGNVSKYGDFSYGLYVCHFPIIQSVAATSLFAEQPALRATFAFLACLIYAVLSWHLVEKLWLRRKSYSAALVVPKETKPA